MANKTGYLKYECKGKNCGREVTIMTDQEKHSPEVTAMFNKKLCSTCLSKKEGKC